MIDVLLSAASIAVGLAVLLTKHADLSTWIKSLLYVLEVVVLVAITLQLGWLGLALALAAVVVATLISSVRLAMQKQHLLVCAAAQGVLEREDAENLFQWARTRRRLRRVNPITRCEFILALSRRHRDYVAAQDMLEPLGMLHLIYGTDPHVLTEKFDRIMRVWNKPTREAEDVADKLVAASKISAATFEEMLDAMASFTER